MNPMFDTREERIDSSPVWFREWRKIVKIRAVRGKAPTTVNSPVRTREYLTVAEVERLMVAARKSSRYGHRDATMILIAFRHGLRASELCDLHWHQVELRAGRLHVRRAKNGSPSVHPLQGDEIRALRRLQREQGPSSHVFWSERGGPMTPKAFHALFGRIGVWAKLPFPCIPTCCGTPAATPWRTRATIPAPYKRGSVTATSSTRCGTQSWRPIASRTFGDDQNRT
jgi:integrase